jgi:hypothetical protein
LRLAPCESGGSVGVDDPETLEASAIHSWSTT